MAEPVFLYILGKFAEAAGVHAAELLARELLNLQSEEVTLLESLHEKVDSLIVGPFNAGVMNLQLAAAPHRSADERHRLLLDARTSFISALGQETRPLNRSLAHVNLAIVWYMLGSKRDVPESLRQAHLEAAKGASMSSAPTVVSDFRSSQTARSTRAAWTI
jgi:hypothetical protein